MTSGRIRRGFGKVRPRGRLCRQLVFMSWIKFSFLRWPTALDYLRLAPRCRFPNRSIDVPTFLIAFRWATPRVTSIFHWSAWLNDSSFSISPFLMLNICHAFRIKQPGLFSISRPTFFIPPITINFPLWQWKISRSIEFFPFFGN